MHCLRLGGFWHKKRVWIPIATNWAVPLGRKKEMKFFITFSSPWNSGKQQTWLFKMELNSDRTGDWELIGISYPLFINIQHIQEPILRQFWPRHLSSLLGMSVCWDVGSGEKLAEETHHFCFWEPRRAIQSAKMPLISFLSTSTS